MTRRFYRVPDEDVDDLRQAYDAGNWAYLISKWNEYKITTQDLCYCLSGVETVQDEMPKLWK